MANIFFDPGVERAAKVQRLFARVAPRYDLMNDLQSFGLHRRWKRRLIELARPQAGEHALDVCCGTGDLALAMAKHQLHVVGLDFSEPMLEIARRRVPVSSPSRDSTVGKSTPGAPSLPGNPTTADREVVFVQGDAQQLPYAANSFDIVTVGYGLRNLEDWAKGLSEMGRVGRPGARLLVLDFGKPANPVWRGLYYAYLKLFVPLLGLLFCGSAGAYAYILESLKHYPAQTGIEAKMRELGLTNVRTVNLLGGVMSINYAEKK